MVDDLIEPVPLPDVFASGLADIEDISHGMIRLQFYTQANAVKIVVARIVIARKILPTVMETLLATI